MKVQLTTTGKVVALVLLVVTLGFVAVHQGPDLRRYLKSEAM